MESEILLFSLTLSPGFWFSCLHNDNDDNDDDVTQQLELGFIVMYPQPEIIDL